MQPVWLLVAVMGVGVVTGTAGQCLEPPRCLEEVDSGSSVMECFQFYRSTNFPVVRLQPTPPLLHPSSSSPDTKSSYSMEHFRWGKPMGRKRRPIRIYTSGGEVEEGEEPPEALMGEMRRRGAAAESDVTQEGGELEEEEGKETEEQLHEKKEGTYRAKSARWSPLLAGKRYGGFMKSGDEHSQRPLLTLFKNVINKDGQEEEEEREQ